MLMIMVIVIITIQHLKKKKKKKRWTRDLRSVYAIKCYRWKFPQYYASRTNVILMNTSLMFPRSISGII